MLAQIPAIVRARLPQELLGFRTVLMGRLLKLYYGDPAFHFEVWFHEAKELVEVAYHAEGHASVNQCQLEELEKRLPDLKEALGPLVELEMWSHSWVRLYRMLSVDYPEQRLLTLVSDALVRMIVVVHPMVSCMVAEPSAAGGEASRLTAVVRGRVQGVGFRYFAVETAEALDLTGEVRNLKGGAVEVIAEGKMENLESLLRDLWEGPRDAQVEGVEAHWGTPTGRFKGFEVKH